MVFSFFFLLLLVDSNFLGLLISDQERTLEQKLGIHLPKPGR